MRPLSWRRLAAFVAIPVLLAAAGCTSSSSGGSTAEIKVGILHSLSGTMSISEMTVKNAELLAIEEINAAGGVLGKQIEPVVEDGASDWPTFAEKAQKLISERQGGDRLRLLDLGQPQGGAARLRGAEQACSCTPCSTRAWRRRRTSSTPAPPPTSRSCPASTTSRRRARRRCSWSAATTSSRAPPTASSRRTPRPTAWRSSARSTRRWAHTDYGHHGQQDHGGQAGRRLQHPQRRQQRRLLQAAQGRRPHRRGHAGHLGVDRRGGGQRHRRRTSWPATWWPGTTTRPPRARRTRSSSRRTRPSTAPTR